MKIPNIINSWWNIKSCLIIPMSHCSLKVYRRTWSPVFFVSQWTYLYDPTKQLWLSYSNMTNDWVLNRWEYEKVYFKDRQEVAYEYDALTLFGMWDNQGSPKARLRINKILSPFFISFVLNWIVHPFKVECLPIPWDLLGRTLYHKHSFKLHVNWFMTFPCRFLSPIVHLYLSVFNFVNEDYFVFLFLLILAGSSYPRRSLDMFSVDKNGPGVFYSF